MGFKRKTVTFDLPDESSWQMAILLPLKSALKKPIAQSDSDNASSKATKSKQPSYKDEAVKPKTRKPSKASPSASSSESGSSSDEGEYEYRDTKRVEYYEDGRKVTTYRRSLSYWP